VLKVVWKSWGAPSHHLPLSLIPSLSLPPHSSLSWGAELRAGGWAPSPEPPNFKPCLHRRDNRVISCTSIVDFLSLNTTWCACVAAAESQRKHLHSRPRLLPASAMLISGRRVRGLAGRSAIINGSNVRPLDALRSVTYPYSFSAKNMVPRCRRRE